MGAYNTHILFLVLNSLTLTLALGFLFLVLWLDPRRTLNLSFLLFSIAVILWTLGTVLGHGIAAVSTEQTLVRFGLQLGEIGFAIACIGIYVFTAMVVRSQSRFLLWVAVAGCLMIVAYHVLLPLSNSSADNYTMDRSSGLLYYSFSPFSVVLFWVFQGGTILLLWLRGRRIRERGVLLGIVLFVTAQLAALLNSRLRSIAFPTLVGDVSLLIISLALVRQQVVKPLVGRASQLESVRQTGLTISSSLRLDEVLAAIAAQATTILSADGAAIYLLPEHENRIVVATVFNMPEQFVGFQLLLGQGTAGRVALDGQAVLLESYAQDWSGDPDLPFAEETLGSVIVAPLVFGGIIKGVLLVAQGRQGKAFNRDDVRLLELLGPQAAVAIANSELFERQSNLNAALEAAKNQLETVLASTQNPVVALDRSLRVIFANPAAANLFLALRNNFPETLARDSTGNFEGLRLPELVPAAILPGNIRAFVRAIKDQRIYIYELDAAQRTYMCYVTPLGHHRPVGWVAILHDITELKELDRLKSQMVRMTSHDLKNPLAGAMLHLDLISEELSDQGNDLVLKDVEIVVRQLERMNRTISGILDLERLKSGVPLHELCSLSSIIEEIIADFDTQARTNNLALISTVPPDLPGVLGDRKQLSHAIINIIDNSIKFTVSGGHICVSARSDDAGIEVSIEDTGIGIPAEMQSQVFERFFRVKQKSMEHVSGSGLGLSLVRDIINAHHGRVWLESKVGEGTTVYLWLPRAELETDAQDNHR